MVRVRLSELLKQKGWTLYRLGKETGIKYPTLHRYVSGQSESIKYAHIDSFCKALGVKPGQLFEFRGD